jgi:protein-tyrosine phosphatase
MRTILYVCTGNTCRSPMAEAIARQWLRQSGVGEANDTFVASAGVFAAEGLPTSPEAVNTLRAMEIDHAGRAKLLTAEMVRKADLVFCMTGGHRRAVLELVGGSDEDREKVLMLDPEADLEDPIGRGQAAYDALAQRMSELIPRRLKETLVP